MITESGNASFDLAEELVREFLPDHAPLYSEAVAFDLNDCDCIPIRVGDWDLTGVRVTERRIYATYRRWRVSQ